MALHPIDVLDASTGRLLSQLVDANLSTICPVNKPHPRVNVIVSGSSRSLYAWRPVSRGSALYLLGSVCSSLRSRASSQGLLPGRSSGLGVQHAMP